MTSLADDPAVLAALVGREALGRKVLLALDFDGTLADIAPRPDDAVLRGDTRHALEALSGEACVAVVSGRELADLRARVPIDGVALAGEHGGEILLANGERRGLELASREEAALDAYARYADLRLAGTGGDVERKRLAVAAHTRGVAEHSRWRLEEALLLRARELARSAEVDAVSGKSVVELRARGASKALGLARLKALLDPAAFVVAVGDDVTDEDLFREASRSGGMSVKVGSGETLAQHRLSGPADVARFLAELVRRL